MIRLCGRTFRRNAHVGNRWQMDSELMDINMTFDATDHTVFEWRLLAAALDVIEASQLADDDDEVPVVCPRCGEPVDPDWFCSEGYCSDCCIETDIHKGGG